MDTEAASTTVVGCNEKHPVCTNTVPLRLSICIATFNRQHALDSTLRGLIDQITSSRCQHECEIVIADNASTDETRQVVSEHVDGFKGLRYVRNEINIGWERNFNSAVQAARGEYCWLMPDDDALKPGAISKVLEALHQCPSVVILNAELVDAEENSTTLLRRRLDFDLDRVYESDETDRSFKDLGLHVQYIGAVVIKRSIWLERIRSDYYGSWFPQVGVIFQDPLPGRTIALSEVLVSISIGRQFWMSSAFEIFSYRWPLLVRSLCISTAQKSDVSKNSLSSRFVLTLRTSGLFSLNDYRQWVRPELHRRHQRLAAFCIAITPGTLLNTLLFFYYVSKRYLFNTNVEAHLHWLRRSPYFLGEG